jgi:hypothetical protein
MSVKAAVKAWNEFFFAPVSPLPIALFRILFALLVIADLVLLRPDWLAWFGQDGWVSMATVRKLEPGVRINLFALMPPGNLWPEVLFWVFLASALFLLMGFMTRASSIAVFVCVASIQQRNPYIIHPGDPFLGVAVFFLMLAPAGAALSLDRRMRIRRGKEGPQIAPKSPWAQRMIQFELAFAYLIACWWKTMGPDWVDGTALYYVWHLDQFRRFPVPAFLQNMVAVKIESWLTMVIEFALGVLVWFKELRYPVLLLGLLLHLSIEYSMNVPLFEWALLSAYVLFIDPDDLHRAMRWVRRRFRVRPVVQQPE